MKATIKKFTAGSSLRTTALIRITHGHNAEAYGSNANSGDAQYKKRRFMNPNVDSESVRKGVDNAFTYWLIDHEISFPRLLEDTFAEVLEQWLENHSTELIAAIANQHRVNAVSETV